MTTKLPSTLQNHLPFQPTCPPHPPALPTHSSTRAIIDQDDDDRALLDGGIGLDLQDAAVIGGAHGFEQIAPGVVDVDEGLVLGDVVEDVDEGLGPAGFGGRDVDPVRADVGFAQVGDDFAVCGDGGGAVGGGVVVVWGPRGRGHAEVGEEAEDEILAALNVFVTPRDGGAELERDAWNRVFHPRRLDRARFARVDFDDVRLGQGGEARVVRQSVVGVHPHRPVGASGQFVFCEKGEKG